MNVQIHSLKFDADRKLLEFVENKTSKLSKLNENLMSAEVFLRLDKSETSDNKVVEIKLEMPRTSLFAKKQSKTFEEATDLAVDALKKQVNKQKGKLRGV
ncbi:MAG: ribosome-associated translation inhibitor RaiA [Chlorobi bacterium]|nr:ribosome-associated translation inhibitor RaiA [Chlorobiota bacterium]